MVRYKLFLEKKEEPKDMKKQNENKLKDLLSVLPKLHKHKMDGIIHEEVRKLRSGRKEKNYKLVLTRKFVTYSNDGENKKIVKELTASAPLPSNSKLNKDAPKPTDILKTLKEQIISQLKELRKQQKVASILDKGEDYTFREGVATKKHAECFLEPGVFIKIQERKFRIDMNKVKTPNTNDKYVGVEIEFASSETNDFIADAFHEAGLSRWIYIHRDSSIKVDDAHPHQVELSILCPQDKYKEIITKVCSILNSKTKTKVDGSCGIHVHLDMRDGIGRDVKQCYVNLLRMQRFMYSMVPVKRKTGTHSVPVEGMTWRLSENHYDGISSSSYLKYKTLEVRMHCGSVQADKIINWIDFLTKIVDAPSITFTPTNISEVKESLKLSEALVNYINGRIAKFYSQHQKNNSHSWLPPVVPPSGAERDDTVVEQSEVA